MDEPTRWQKLKPYAIALLIVLGGVLQTFKPADKMPLSQLITYSKPYPVPVPGKPVHVNDSLIEPLVAILPGDENGTRLVRHNDTNATVNYNFRVLNNGYAKNVDFTCYFMIKKNGIYYLDKNPKKDVSDVTINKQISRLCFVGVAGRKTDSDFFYLKATYNVMKSKKKRTKVALFEITNDNVYDVDFNLLDTVKHKFHIK